MYRPGCFEQLQALTCATRNGAGLLLVGNEYGTLEPGKKADFAVLDDDPARDIKNTRSIDAVWKNGIKVSGRPF